jgi:hypothetical protein
LFYIITSQICHQVDLFVFPFERTRPPVSFHALWLFVEKWTFESYSRVNQKILILWFFKGFFSKNYFRVSVAQGSAWGINIMCFQVFPEIVSYTGKHCYCLNSCAYLIAFGCPRP